MNKPNVLLICVEHWPGSLLGCAGHRCVLTPTLDRLAASGVRFTNAYSATPTCIPARRALMTGTTAKTHGDRIFNQYLEMPNLPTMASVFSDAGYQTYAVGKMHVYPQRNRVGFDDVILNEEGRHHLGMKADDYELYLAENGFPGQELTHGMCNNDYMMRPWHLPEHCHPTNWTTHQMCKTIKRRDPRKPAFWYMSFNASHPPIVPLAEYVDMYRDAQMPDVLIGDWARDHDKLPYLLKDRVNEYKSQEFLDNPLGLKLARQGYYAMCTHVDHQIRLVIGMLREENLLDNTIIMFTADHGEMLGNHWLFAKDVLYEDSANVPMILVPTADYKQCGHHLVDDRLVELRDIMPTLLEMAEIDIPDSVEGVSMLSETKRDHIYGEHYEDEMSNRMIRDKSMKLIYYPLGNHFQLFDLESDPDELYDLSGDSRYNDTRKRLTSELIKHLYGQDLGWLDGDILIGMPEKEYPIKPYRGLLGQRGWRFM